MSIAISEDHRALADTAGSFLEDRAARRAARELLTAEREELPAFWKELADLGWLGLHVSEGHGGSGFGLPELVVVTEVLGRYVVPGPFVPTVIVSAVLEAVGPEELKAKYLPGLTDGSLRAAVGLQSDIQLSGTSATGTARAVLGAGLAELILLPCGEDVILVERDEDGVDVVVPVNLDPTRRAGQVTLRDATAAVLTGGRTHLVDLARLVLAAEATGIARQCTQMAADYARSRVQFGRVIGTYQAVKHHCANMLVETELATAAVWDAARAAAAGGPAFSYNAAMAAALAIPAADLCAQLNIQVHGGIGFTWEHDGHLYLRRASAVEALLDAEEAAEDITGLARQGVKRQRSVDLPPEAEAVREEVRRFVAGLKDLSETQVRTALLDSGYAVPHWPTPWGRDAGAVEQLVIEQEFNAAGVKRPAYGITGWVILTLVQHANEDQVARWVRPALNQELIWCQLFSEPDAGSDAAGIKTRATRVDGGWLINGQKVWTSGAHLAAFGLATVRTDPDAPKHNGITCMVIDMKATGVEVRPLKQVTGDSDFNEVFFDDVFVPDDDVVGPVDGGWTVARATLGNESVSIGGGQGGMSLPGEALIPPLDAHPERLAGGAVRVGRYIARTQSMDAMNLRTAQRAVAGGGPGPEGNVTKLVLSENGHEAAAILAALSGPDGAYLEGAGAMSGALVLLHRAMSIAGGTSEIKRNQIGERILGLPRDPLIK
ncbi:MAG TPA: acyl-CoA dehydrogenase [Acidimicrobiales bacterium]|nr:acyl-CoA dehydrogenase [Acidimicrobiales bacterium]